MDNNQNNAPDFKELMREMRLGLDRAIMEQVTAPVQAAAGQIPVIMARKDWEEETKKEALELLQLSATAPFVGALVFAAMEMRMDLPTMLYNVGQGWEELRSKLMAHATQQQINRPKGPNEETPE